MTGFGFSLAANTHLREDKGSYYLLSNLPVKIIRLNRSFFFLLKHIQSGGELSEFVDRYPGLTTTTLLTTLLSLVAKGYLKLERIAEICDYPCVSIIVPVRDRTEDLVECLNSLAVLDYPEDRKEIIVVDDGSEVKVSDVVTSPGVKVIRLEESKGPAACRNLGSKKATGEILAFLDADCVAMKNWLREIIPFLQAAQAGAAGGYVSGYHSAGFLDRYEEVASSLNLGKKLIIEGRSESGFYVPTANMLVDRQIFKAVGGFREGMQIGEDVDFCWRLRNSGYTLLYSPFGCVAHKHRNRLGSMLKRRSHYGMSESVLYRSHRDKRKTFFISLYSSLSLLLLMLSIIFLSPYPLLGVLLFFFIDVGRKSKALKNTPARLSLPQTVSAAFRSHLSFFYFALFHFTRYYLVLVVALGILWYPLWIIGGLAIIYTSIVDFHVKKPRLQYPFFLVFYVSEHLAYQAGVFWGCLRAGYFGSYLVRFRFT